MDNKTKRILTIFAIIYFIFVFTSIIINLIIDKPEIHWEIIIPIFIIIFIVGIIKIIKFRKLLNLILKKDYNQVLKYSKKFKSLHKRNLSLYNQQYCYSLAEIFIENNDYNNFEYYINKIKNHKIIGFKYFWKSIRAYQNNNNLDFNKNYSLFYNNTCLYKKWGVAYEQYSEILSIFYNYVNERNIDVERINYYKNMLELKTLKKIFKEIALNYNI